MEARARAAYEAFVAALGGVARWDELDERERSAWRAVAASAARVEEHGRAVPRAIAAGSGARFDRSEE